MTALPPTQPSPTSAPPPGTPPARPVGPITYDDLERLVATTRTWPWALIVTATLAIWVPLKLLRVARQDTTITLAIAQSSDKTAMIPGLIILGLAVVLPTVFVLIANSTIRMVATFIRTLDAAANDPQAPAPGRLDLKRLLIATAATASLLVVMIVAQPVWVSAISLAGLAIVSLIDVTVQDKQRLERTLTRHLQPHPRRAVVTLVAIVFLGVLALAWPAAKLPLSDQMWLPTHHLEVNTSATRHEDGPQDGAADGAARSYVGYILDQSSDEILLLTEADRRLVTIATGDITSQTLCQLDETYETRSLLDLITSKDRSRTPSCDTAGPAR